MNRQEKEQYLREYSLLKQQGKPFFPYAVAKDAIMMMIVMVVIIAMSIILGAELGPKADPTTTTYVPRPEWYFFFLFEVLRVIKPAVLTPVATIGVPSAIASRILFFTPKPARRGLTYTVELQMLGRRSATVPVTWTPGIAPSSRTAGTGAAPAMTNSAAGHSRLMSGKIAVAKRLAASTLGAHEKLPVNTMRAGWPVRRNS